MSKIKVYTTGGSIDKGYDLVANDFVVGPPEVTKVLAEANVAPSWEVCEFIRKDSIAITDDERMRLKELIAADPSKRIIVTHGTDTMVTTARALSTISGKVIVLTGAMQPASFKNSDAHFNLGAAFLAVQLLPAGTYLVMNGRVFDPFAVTKNVSSRSFIEVPKTS